MNSLIIDAARKKICLTLIKDENIYSISHENSKTNYEKLTILINDFLTIDKQKICALHHASIQEIDRLQTQNIEKIQGLILVQNDENKEI